jgi:hypothetical protein
VLNAEGIKDYFENKMIFDFAEALKFSAVPKHLTMKGYPKGTYLTWH